MNLLTTYNMTNDSLGGKVMIITKGKKVDIPLKNSFVRVPGIQLNWMNDERYNSVRNCIQIWNAIISNIENPEDVTGAHRFDLVPGVNAFGEVYIDGIYEDNGNSIECPSAAAAMEYFGGIKSYAIRNFVANIKKSFGNEIIFVAGRCLVKDYWKAPFIAALRRAGLKVICLSPNQFINTARDLRIPAYIWGDVRRSPGESHFSERFVDKLYEEGDDFFFFNSLKTREPSCKTLLPDEWSSRFSMDDVLSQRKDLVVLKPTGGASGNGVIFGCHFTDQQWEKKVKECQSIGGYSAWLVMWLPKLPGTNMAFDLSMTFWVQNGQISYDSYLYTVVRVEDYGVYKKRGTMNVAKRAGVLPIFY